MLGHRGAGEAAASGLPENTLESARAAHAAGAGWVELDVRRTADAELVLHHDPVLPDGRAVDEATAPDARAQGVATLEEVVGALPAGLGVDLDVKVALVDAGADDAVTTAGRVAERALALIDERPLVVTSFSAVALLQVRRLAGATVPTGLLGLPLVSLRELVTCAVGLGARVVAPHVLSTGLVEVAGLPSEPPDRVREALAVARGHGCETLVWGVRPDQIPELADLGVAAVCVDEVAAAVAAARRRHRTG